MGDGGRERTKAAHLLMRMTRTNIVRLSRASARSSLLYDQAWNMFAMQVVPAYRQQLLLLSPFPRGSLPRAVWRNTPRGY
jgi:hypothetical protein